jgi:hypothetical protein
MSKVSVDELERAITVLKTTANEQQMLLEEAGATPRPMRCEVRCKLS